MPIASSISIITIEKGIGIKSILKKKYVSAVTTDTLEGFFVSKSKLKATCKFLNQQLYLTDFQYAEGDKPVSFLKVLKNVILELNPESKAKDSKVCLSKQNCSISDIAY